MENNHKGSEYQNVIETWEQNEKNKNQDQANPTAEHDAAEPSTRNNLDQVIKQEGDEYENDNKENRVLGGDRATVNDDTIIQPS